MTASRLILVGGGARSGKSDFALDYARRLGPRRLFLATAQALDDEMHARIDRHRQDRGPGFDTVEEPIDIVRVLLEARDVDVILLDCLTLWLSNLLVSGLDASEVAGRLAELSVTLAQRTCHVVIVTNEVGLGVVPDNELARTFRDLAGRAHRELARTADEVYFAALGMMLRLKPTLEVADSGR